jgi:DNA-binding CsgD family transcriptional regulator
MSLGLMGVTCLAAGALDAAEAHVGEALATYESLADEWGVATAQEVLGAIAAMRGDAARAATLATEALVVHRRLGGRENISRTLDVLGLAAFLRQDLATAAARFEESLALRRAVLNRTGTASALSYLGMVAQADSDYDRAAELYRECLALAHEIGDRATLIRCLGQVAALALERGADRMTVARLASAVARQRAALGLPTPPVQRAAAERFLSSLRAGLGPVGLGAAFVAGQVLSLSRAYQLGLSLLDGIGSAQPRVTAGQPAVGPERLTRRETEVAALVAQGLTNRQIAEELVVAQRTVDTHVERILAKLGFSSRAQVAAWAAQQGLLATAPAT